MTLTPFFGRVVLIDSPVEETEHDSGIFVPHRFDGDDGVKRAVVSSADDTGSWKSMYDRLQPGTVVYYRTEFGTKIGDFVVVGLDAILALEE